MYIDSDVIVVSIRAHQYKKAVTHMMMAHQYKLALRRQVHKKQGDPEPGTTIQARAAAEGNNIRKQQILQ